MAATTGAWTCAACGRLVPPAVPNCRCGLGRPEPVAHAPEVALPPRVSAGVSRLAVVALGVIIVALVGALAFVIGERRALDAPRATAA
ncbi:MAG TPA: hypothetical protein VGL62_00300, partial [Vicinamibacterales bacterium]